MPTYSRTDKGVERHGVRAVKTPTGLERMASVWLKTASGIMKVYEAVRSCFAAKKWRYNRPWLYKDKWKY